MLILPVLRGLAQLIGGGVCCGQLGFQLSHILSCNAITAPCITRPCNQ